jgi:hypothetical protein
VLVTPFGPGAGFFCNLTGLWATPATGAPSTVLVRDVACYNVDGRLQRHASLITYTSAR